MGWRPDLLLLELFESMHKDLATALDIRQRLDDCRRKSTDGATGPRRLETDAAGADDVTLIDDQTNKIARLRIAIAEIEGALEQRESRIVH